MANDSDTSTSRKVFISRSTDNGGSYIKGETPPSKPAKTTTTNVAKKSTTTTTTHKNTSRSSTSSHGKSYSGSISYVSSPRMSPTEAFEYDGIQFFGSAQSKLNSVDFKKGDLIVNCTHSLWKPPKRKPFIKTAPDWLEVDETMPAIELVKPDQVHLDWPDMKSPPEYITLEFWKNLLAQIKNAGIQRVFVCCTAGQGRTGTALSSFILASGLTQDSEVAVEYIRTAYSSHAVETKRQEEYLDYLAFGEIAFEKDFRSKIGLNNNDDDDDDRGWLVTSKKGKNYDNWDSWEDNWD